MIYGYARVSTKDQETNGYSLEAQEKVLLAEGCNKIYKDSFTGSKSDRPKFKKILSVLTSGDTLVVTKLDRFARSVIDGARIAQDLIERGVKINILNMGYLDNTPASKLTRTIFFAFAEFEREMIIERTQAGKAIAREKQGFYEGRPPKYTDHQINSALDLLKNNSYNEVERMTKISKSTLTRAMRKRKNK
jgi:DNA invertase Pin-like site-specific DNA recombinase